MVSSGTGSLSIIVTEPWESSTTTFEVTLAMLTKNVSSFSSSKSPNTLIVICLAESLGANVRVPPTIEVKSTPAAAVPAAVP
ncbi:hypothetical protein D3C83_151070 [compost metagenome]